MTSKETEFPKHVEMYIKSATIIRKADRMSNEFIKRTTGEDIPFKDTIFLAPDIVLKAITGDKKVREILDKGYEKFRLFTSDFAMYEALGSVSKKEIDMEAMSNFLLKILIIPSIKLELNMDRIEHLRKSIK